MNKSHLLDLSAGRQPWRQLRRLSPVTVYAALSELPRGALMNVEDAPD